MEVPADRHVADYRRNRQQAALVSRDPVPAAWADQRAV
jgi:hypothetical protein